MRLAGIGAAESAMAGERFSLDLLGPIILETRDRLARIETDIATIKDKLEHHNDELTVVSGLAMRATGERIAWASMQNQLKKLAARIEALERQGR
jgi:BMFP domain-containing protein YqiC